MSEGARPTRGGRRTGISLREHVVIRERGGQFVASVPFSDFTTTGESEEDAWLEFKAAYESLLMTSQEERDKLASFIGAHGSFREESRRPPGT